MKLSSYFCGKKKLVERRRSQKKEKYLPNLFLGGGCKDPDTEVFGERPGKELDT